MARDDLIARWGASSKAMGAPKKRQDPVTPHFIHRAFVIVDLVDEELEDLDP